MENAAVVLHYVRVIYLFLESKPAGSAAVLGDFFPHNLNFPPRFVF